MRKGRRSVLLLAVAIVLLVVGFPGAGSSAETDKEKDAPKPAAEAPAGKTSQPANDASGSSGNGKLTPVTTTKLAAENADFRLYIDDQSGQVRVQSKKTGTSWYGSPPVDASTPPNNLNLIASPLMFRYTEGKGTTQTYPSKEKAKIAAKSIDGGARFEYTIDSLGLSFALEYRLTNTGLEAKIPFDSIRETASQRLTSLEVLPFFDAATPKNTGALLLPDGSGAIMKFKQTHPDYFEPYSQFIYGGDPAFQTNVNESVAELPFETVSFTPREKAALPVFGLYKDRQAFLGIVTQGESDAKINATPSGLRNIDLYRSSTEFLYRNDDVIFVGKSGAIPLVENQIIPGDRAVRYELLENGDADYVGMAKAYRSYLLKEKGLKPVAQQQASLQLRIFGGVLRSEIIGTTFISMTSFDQARTIVDRYLSEGVSSIEVTYDGWTKDGKYGDQPAQFPPASQLGGNGGLQKLAAYLKEKRIPIYVNANYVKPFQSSDSLHPSSDAIRGLNKDVMKVQKPFVTTRQLSRQTFYLLKPERVFDRFIAKESDQYAKAGITGVHLDYMGDTIYSDHDKTPFRRQQTIGVWQRSLDLLRQKTGRAAVDYGFAYTFGHADRIDDAPLDSSHFTYEDEAIPFYQIALHGLIPYTAKPSNLQDDPRTQLLRTLEYGAVPSYSLTYKDSSLFKRTMVDNLFSTAYGNWVTPSINEYKKAADILNPVAQQAITNHETLAPGVKRTTYSDGTQITVNYNAKPVSIGGQNVAGYGYAVTKGGGGK